MIQFQREKETLLRFSDKRKGEMRDICFGKIKNAKDKVIGIVEGFFATLEKMTLTALEQHQLNHPGEYKQINERVSRALTDLEKTYAKINGPDFIKPMLKVLENETHNEYDTMMLDIKAAISIFTKDLTDIKINEKVLYNINELLGKYARIDTVLTEKENPESLNNVELTYMDDLNLSNSPGNIRNPTAKHFHTEGNAERMSSPSKILRNSTGSPNKRVLDELTSDKLHQNNNYFRPYSKNFIESRERQRAQSSSKQNQSENINEKLMSEGYKQNMIDKNNLRGQPFPRSVQKHPVSSTALRTEKHPGVTRTLGSRDNLISSVEEALMSQRGRFKYFNYIPQYEESLVIKLEDYFERVKIRDYLHFFQDNSCFLHLKNLNSQGRDFDQTIEIKNRIKIPVFHRSVITSSGEIYLTGGLDHVSKRRAVSNVWVFDYAKDELEPCAPMNYARHSHSICFVKPSIYVFGGVVSEQDEYLLKCEKYDINTGRWTAIADCKNRRIGSAIATFRDRYIFKFGGKTDMMDSLKADIEMYSIQKDAWVDVKINPSDGIYFSYFSASMQINQNQILLFGGKGNQGWATDCYIFSVRDLETDAIGDVKRMRGSIKGSFWSQPIYHGGKIYAIENVPNEKGKDLYYFEKKSILVLDETLNL